MAKETKTKLEDLWNTVSKNENDIANIKRIVVQPINYSNVKKTQVITILDNFLLSTQSLSPELKLIWGVYDVNIVVPFDNIPTWGLSGVTNRILFYGSESQILDPATQNLNILNYSHWQFKDDKYIYRTYIRFNVFESEISDFIPVYVDFDILIKNPRKYINQQGYKS